jgi:hypothetical protein
MAGGDELKACENCGALYGRRWGRRQFVASRACSRACACALGQRGRSWPALEDRFWRKVDKSPGHGPGGDCWIWCGATLPDGYGQARAFGRLDKAHRVAFRLSGRDIPNGAMVLHSCDVRGCVNPSHLRLGDHVRNMADMVERGRGRAPQGQAHHAAKLAPCDVRAIRADGRPAGELAAVYGVSKGAIDAIRAGRNWRHLS